MRLSELAISEVARLLNGKGHPYEGAVAHLSLSATRAAESLSYLADIDQHRFQSVWPIDRNSNDVVDEAHVRWASSSALTCLDLCIAAAAKLSDFFIGTQSKEVSIRNYYQEGEANTKNDKRNLVIPPWRSWLDAVISDHRYSTLLKVRHALVHGDMLRASHLSMKPLTGHESRYGYYLGPLVPPVTSNTHTKMMGRDIIEMSRAIAQDHAANFVAVLQGIP